MKSKVGGFIKEIHVDEGQEVKKRDILFKLDAIEYYEAVREAEAALKQAEAEYQMTAYDVDRISRLVEKEILAEVRLKQAQAELAVAGLFLIPGLYVIFEKAGSRFTKNKEEEDEDNE